MTKPKKRQRGRPAKVVKRDIHKQIRVNADENKRFERGAARRGLDFSAWMRGLAEADINAA